MIRAFAKIAAAMLTLAVTGEACAPRGHSATFQPDNIILQAVFADNTLWLLSANRTLSTIKIDNDQRVAVPLDRPVLDLALQRQKSVAVTCDTKDCANWRLRQWRGDGWKTELTVPSQGDDFRSIHFEGDAVTLLTSRRIVEITDDGQKSANLSGPLHKGNVTAMVFTPDGLLVAFDAGEWGGGVQRIDASTGVVATIESNRSGRLCGGPLNTKCDPVTGLATEPGKPNCAIATIGLAHLSAHGRIVEICGDKIQRLYFKPFGRQPPHSGPAAADEPFSTVPFYGLVQQGGALWTAGIDGIYRLGSHGSPQWMVLPRYTKIGGVFVSFTMPKLIQIRTVERLAAGGGIPLLVSR